MQTTDVLWSEFHSRMHGFVARRVNNPADVDDIVQDIFLRVHQKLDTLQQTDRLHAWMYQIARNAITDYYRSPRRRREEQMPGTLAASLTDPDDATDDALSEIAGCVAPILNALPDQQREAIQLTEFNGMSQRTAADALGISHSGMKSRVQRARKQVKDSLLNCCQIELDRRGGIINFTPPAEGCTCCDDCAPTQP